MSIWECNENGNNCLAGVGMGMRMVRLMNMGGNGKAESHSRTSLLSSNRFATAE